MTALRDGMGCGWDGKFFRRRRRRRRRPPGGGMVGEKFERKPKALDQDAPGFSVGGHFW